MSNWKVNAPETVKGPDKATALAMAPENAAREIIVHHVVESPHPDRRREQEGMTDREKVERLIQLAENRIWDDQLAAMLRSQCSRWGIFHGRYADCGEMADSLRRALGESVPDSLQPDPEDREARCSCTPISSATYTAGANPRLKSGTVRWNDPDCPAHGTRGERDG